MAIKNNQASIDKQKVVKLFFISLIAVFVVETLVMLAFHAFLESLHLPPLTEGFLDSFVLSLFLFPVFYFLFFRPLSLEVDKRACAERTQQIQEREYATMIQTSMDGFFISDTQGRILDVNDSYCRLIGSSREELLAMSIFDVEAAEKPQETAAHMKKICAAGSGRFETRHRCKNGTIVDIEVSVNYRKDPQERFFVFLRDITERKRNEEYLMLANKELVKLDRLKTDFVTTISHELRTPMGVMREGVSQVAEGMHGVVNAEQKRYLGKSLQHIDRLTKIVNSILELSALEAGKIGIKKEAVDIVAIAKEMIGIFKAPAQNKGLEIRSNFEKEKIELHADREKIAQVLLNLIDNGIKFTEKGCLEVKIADTSDAIEFVVSDTGVGMSDEDIPKAMDGFQQFQRVYGPGEKGVGAGLAIAREIIRLHGGRIWVESEPGKGTRVNFSLPKG